MHFWCGNESTAASCMSISSSMPALPCQSQVLLFVHSLTRPRVLGAHVDLILCQL